MTENFNIVKFLKSAVATGASDEHLHVGSAPYVRINGFVKKINMPALTKEDLDDAIVEIAPEGKKAEICYVCSVYSFADSRYRPRRPNLHFAYGDILGGRTYIFIVFKQREITCL